jgi:hypothetical protein
MAPKLLLFLLFNAIVCSTSARKLVSINGNNTETERDVETLVDYRNNSTAAIRKVTLENKTETERDVG